MQPGAPISPHVAGVCVIRNAVDLAPFLCGHYLRVGFAHLLFIDDGSSDGTFEYLSRAARRTKRVSVRQVHHVRFHQEALMNQGTNAMIAKGYPIIVPFDADEIWNASAAQFESRLASAETAAVRGRWINFVQARDNRLSRVHRLPGMRFQTSGLASADQPGVCGYAQSFVCLTETKVAFRAYREVELERGQHRLAGYPAAPNTPSFEIFHLPLRSRHEIVKRGSDYEPRRAPLRRNARMSWQSAFHGEVVAAGKVDAVWAANSYDANGQLDVYGVKTNLMADDRLRSLLFRAAWYLFSRFGLLPF